MMAVYPYILNWLKENNIECLVDIGAGEGYLGSIIPNDIPYTGIEPSKYLVDIAHKQYSSSNLNYRLGSAYDTGLENENTDGAVSVLVWFHLSDLATSAKELQRNLKPGGKFLIITSNSKSRKVWESYFVNLKISGDTLSGVFSTELSTLQESEIHIHPNEKIAESLVNAGLTVESIETIGLGENEETKIFIAISGTKNM
jgi:SAM-dependent methyltransferase